MNRTNLFVAACCVGGLLAGCASTQVPADRIASSEAAVRAANEVGAKQNPQAALHLRLAEEQLAQAKNLVKEGDNKRAEWVLMRAESDAEVAVSLSREGAAKVDAQQSLDRVRAMKSQPGGQPQPGNQPTTGAH